MWHELVLHGVGGRTIAEAKERLTYEEARSWFAYIQKRGSLHFGRRLEQIIAMIMPAWVKVADPYALMPHESRPQADSADFHTLSQMLQGVARGNEKSRNTDA
ncbi:phage protein [Alcanivorax xiamenensis]|uniref:Phage protein n=1 Tax=Alcanivorax xiamenensis TaxID=1177156 RepID=A0ABQ6Y6D9_9GAMM|nr:phage protein [Alcanivorax xiamenensis]